MTDKETARQNFLQTRRAHAPEKRSDDQALKSRLDAFLAEFSGPIMAYRPLPTEADPFADEIHFDWCYPRVDGEAMTACAVRTVGDFHRSSLGIWEPSSDCAVIKPRDLSVILIPGLAFDRQGNRLGFGKGYYDRFLKNTDARVQRVGVCYSFQVSSEQLPREDWDERVHWIVTERYVLNVQGKD